MNWYQELAKPAWALVVLTPYLVWVMIATALQSSVTWLDR